jgi:hypothetical protein
VSTHVSLTEEELEVLTFLVAPATREERLDDVPLGHAEDVLMYDVIPPTQYKGEALHTVH